MATAVAVGPALATLTPALGGSVLRSVVGGAVLRSSVGAAVLAQIPIGDAHILTTPSTPPASPTTAAVGSAVVGTSTVG